MKPFDKKVDEQMLRLIEQIGEAEPASDEQNRLIEELAKLQKIRIESSRGRKDDIFRAAELGVKTAGIVLPMISFAKWLDICMEFEKSGVITSSATKSLMKFIKPVLKG